MVTMKKKFSFILLFTLVLSITAAAQETMIVRLAEIEVYPKHLQEYLKFANEVDRLSVEREPGVVCLFPMQSAEDSTQIRILEIYFLTQLLLLFHAYQLYKQFCQLEQIFQ